MFAWWPIYKITPHVSVLFRVGDAVVEHIHLPVRGGVPKAATHDRGWTPGIILTTSSSLALLGFVAEWP